MKSSKEICKEIVTIIGSAAAAASIGPMYSVGLCDPAHFCMGYFFGHVGNYFAEKFSRNRAYYTIGTAAAAGTLVEAIEHFGMLSGASDLGDLALTTLGGVLYYALYRHFSP